MKRNSMRKPIPAAMREKLAADPFMRTCCLKGHMPCDGKIEWNHFFQYAGKRQSEIYGILPLCQWHHAHEAAFRGLQAQIMRQRIHHFAAEKDFREKYPRSTLLK